MVEFLFLAAKCQDSCFNMAAGLLIGQVANQGWIPSRGLGSSQRACQLCGSHQPTNLSVPASISLLVKYVG